MKPYRIKILGDEFLVCSSLQKDEINPKERKENTVIIGPSLKEDFKVSSYDIRQSPSPDLFSNAILATRFLIEKRGLPLEEFSFDVCGTNLNVFYTGEGVFTIKPQKCKLLYTKTELLKGCEVTIRDVNVGCVFRTVSVENLKDFDKELLSLLTLTGECVPSAALASSLFSGTLSFSMLSDFSKRKPTELTAYVAAAYSEYLKSCGRVRSFTAKDERLKIEFTDGAIKICLKERYPG